MTLHFDPSITFGNVISLFGMILTLGGIWLRTEKVLVRLEERQNSSDTRLDGLDVIIRDLQAWARSISSHPHQ